MSVAVVTGAGRGIGRAIASELAARGMDVAALGRDEAALAAVADEVRARGRRALAVHCDAARADEVEAAARRIVAELGVPTVVIPNAGVVHRRSILDTTEAQWDEQLDVNLKGLFLAVRAFLPKMLEAKRGRFVAIGSISGTLGTPRLAAYCASKWGTVGFVKSFAEELRGTGLQAMCVMPGSVDTDMLKGSGFAPAMQPEDVARIVAWLSLEAPNAMNGSCVDAFGP
ncbi:MAG: SDR family oxidoreductase [Labilithrix sp.]|nr:SDR family oxidoreductase [Labilithrix sp.]MCW5811101.1 SDR family oxidoreductase [Labilithrix sp.]